MKIKRILDHFEEYILLPSLTFSVGLIFVQVVMRYVFQHSLSWSEELARYIFVWQLWLGVSYAAKNQSHIRITIIENFLNEAQRKILETIVIVIWFGFGCFVIVQGYKIAMQIGAYGQTSSALGLPMVYAYMSVPVGASLMNIRLIQNLVGLYCKPNKPKALEV
ncbi:MAG: TRAP transporter small permease [Clostridiales Family XIII bacterium]|jgi:TRAP-type C4-dicarboxylate transport system permease small subunit|nr:TRAP transporter small permease [Clostridiales Family XIII bacterium]